MLVIESKVEKSVVLSYELEGIFDKKKLIITIPELPPSLQWHECDVLEYSNFTMVIERLDKIKQYIIDNKVEYVIFYGNLPGYLLSWFKDFEIKNNVKVIATIQNNEADKR